jgi:hypothetical protein
VGGQAEGVLKQCERETGSKLCERKRLSDAYESSAAVRESAAVRGTGQLSNVRGPTSALCEREGPHQCEREDQRIGQTEYCRPNEVSRRAKGGPRRSLAKAAWRDRPPH